MRVHVLLYDANTQSEGIHSLELSGRTVVLMFEDRDDADRYAGLLEAQDFPVPSIETLERSEIEEFCIQAGYEAQLVSTGFMPKTNEELLLIAPPESNRDVSDWRASVIDPVQTDALEAIRRRLEGLL